MALGGSQQRACGAACNVGCGNYTFPNEAFVERTAQDMVKLGLRDADARLVSRIVARRAVFFFRVFQAA